MRLASPMRLAWLPLLLALPAGLEAQGARSSALDSLAAAATRASARFADRAAAVSSGYRRIGPDFPGMGEHWLHPGVLLSGKVDADHPTILIFATIADRPTLLGVGFVMTTRGAEQPAGVPGWPDAWHEHSGLLSEESGVAPGARAAGETHVWVLHVWTTLPNPGGAYAPDNWSLPFARAGLSVPHHVDVDAARALSLAVKGDAYLRDLLTDAGVRSASRADAVDGIIAASRARVVDVVARSRGRPAVSPVDLAALRAEWSTLARSLRSIAGPEVDRFLAPPHPTAATGEPHRGAH